MSLDAVIFDAGGVLLLPDPESFRALLSPHGIVPDDETCRRAHYAGMHEVDRLEEIKWPDVDRVVARELGVTDTGLVEELLPGITAIYEQLEWLPVPHAAETLRALEKAGYPLAVVSNATGTMEHQLARREVCSVEGGAAAQVSIVIDSHVVGVEKPDPRIFDFALEVLGVPADRCMYVGDSVYFDVNGSRAAGLTPAHLDPFGMCDATDHHHFAGMDEVATYFRAD